MENIYNDFTTRLLPKVAEGLQITKEYFTELFGRYTKYLIITDSIMLAINFIILVATITAICIYLPKTLKIKDSWGVDPLNMFWIFILFPLVVSFVNVLAYTDNLIKDIYVPEIRIYQELTNFQKINND